MKNLLLLLIIFFSFSGCSKDKSVDKPGAPQESYINSNAGSEWHYTEVNSSAGTPVTSDYTITSANKDTSINSKSYHVYTYSYGGSEYLLKDGNDYYEYSEFNQIGQAFERLYLKGNGQVNSSWSQNFNIQITNPDISVPVTVKNVITEIADRTVNGTLYKNVVHVKTSLETSLIPADKFTTDINSYYAPSVGLIENSTLINVDYMGTTANIDVSTTLKSATLK